MNNETRAAVHKLLKDFTKRNLKVYDIELLKKQYPFHRLFFDDDSFVAFKRERTMVTKMGDELYPQLAKAIASGIYKDVTLEAIISGVISKAASQTINSIVRQLREPRKKGEAKHRRTPNHEKELQEIKTAAAGDTEKEEVEFIADIYIGDFPGGPFFAEIKTPMPNLDICAQSKHKILTFKTILDGQNPKGYLAFAYNPYLTREKYRHSPTKRVMDLEKEVLMGIEFWDLIGGQGTYSTLLEIIEDVAKELLAELPQPAQGDIFESSHSVAENEEDSYTTDEE